MKKVVLCAIMLSMGVQVFSQDVLYSTKVKREEVPAVIIESVTRDYPDFTMEEFAAVPIEYVDTDVFINKSVASLGDYDTFEVALTGKGREFTATYDKSGKLLSTMEHERNITPPAAVRNAIVKAYPGWTLAKDTYNMTHYAGSKERQRYRMELTKGGEKIHVYVDANGKIVNRSEMHKKG